MRDLKTSGKKSAKVRTNKRKREKRELNWRKFLRRFLYVGVAVSSCTLTVVGLFFLVQLTLTSDLFHVDQVVVSGCEQLQQQQVVDLSDISLGVNTFDLDLDLIGQQIEANPWVARAGVQRIFPSHISIELQERKSVAIINLGLLYYLDEGGEVFKVLDAGDDLDYPMITGFDYQRIEADDPAYSVALLQIVALIADLQQRSELSLQQISEIHLEETGGLALYTRDDAVMVRLGRENFVAKLDRLEKIYARLRPQLKVLDYIDLSVDEKVIVRIERPARSVRS
jgi:cell division protein FtsQ